MKYLLPILLLFSSFSYANCRTEVISVPAELWIGDGWSNDYITFKTGPRFNGNPTYHITNINYNIVQLERNVSIKFENVNGGGITTLLRDSRNLGLAPDSTYRVFARVLNSDILPAGYIEASFQIRKTSGCNQ